MNQSDYEEYRKRQIQSGQVFQDFVVDCCYHILHMPISPYGSKLYQQNVGESINGVEIKNDRYFGRKEKPTGQLWIETAEKARPRSGDYAKSGIYRNDNTWLYIIGDYNTIFVFAKKMLLGLHSTGKYPQQENRTKTSLGFFLSVEEAMKYAAIVMTPNAEEKISKCVHEMHQMSSELLRSMLEGDTKQMMLDFGKE